MDNSFCFELQLQIDRCATYRKNTIQKKIILFFWATPSNVFPVLPLLPSRHVIVTISRREEVVPSGWRWEAESGGIGKWTVSNYRGEMNTLAEYLWSNPPKVNNIPNLNHTQTRHFFPRPTHLFHLESVFRAHVCLLRKHPEWSLQLHWVHLRYRSWTSNAIPMRKKDFERFPSTTRSEIFTLISLDGQFVYKFNVHMTFERQKKTKSFANEQNGINTLTIMQYRPSET